MPKSAEEITDLYRERRRARASILNHAQRISQVYNDEMPVPLPELDANELPAVANLIQVGLDQKAMRIASTFPNVEYPPLKPGFKNSEEKARSRREATLGWYTSNNMTLKLRRRARWLIGYASAPVMIVPDSRNKLPRWRNLNPLGTFPGSSYDPDDITPPDCIYGYQRTVAWLKREYPDTFHRLRLPRGAQDNPDTPVDIVEYVDDEERVLVACGRPHDPVHDLPEEAALSSCEVLARAAVRIGMCPVVIPSNINLDDPRGHFDGVIGLYRDQAEIAALRKHAVRKAIFPELWMVARQNETPQLVTPADPKEGIIGEISGADLREVNLEPTVLSLNTEDRLAEAIRQSGGVPAEFSGQAATNVRTGKRAEQLLSAVVDFPVQEAQDLLARSIEAENVRAIEVDKAFWGNQKKSFHMAWGRSSRRVDYTPNDTFEDSVNIVTFPLAGADANGFTIRGGQKIGLGTMARKTFMERDPDIDDAEQEMDRIVFERLAEGVLVEFEQPQSLPLPIKAQVARKILQNKKEIFEAIIEAQEELQEQQADQAGGDPMQQPGLMDPAAGAQPPPQAPGLAELFGRLNL